MTAKPYTPTRESPAALDERTVGTARDVVNRIAGRIVAGASTGNLAHTLVYGPRGSGKTHALTVAVHRAGEALGPPLPVVVVVPEDAVGVRRVVDIVRLVGRALDVPGVDDRAPSQAELQAGIAEALGDRILVLVVENLDRLFASLGDTGQHDFRAWLEESRRILLLASTPALFRAVQSRAKPFFGSFATEPLDELTVEEGHALLRHLRPDLADYLATDVATGRVEAVHRITGGSPRLWVILAQIVSVDRLDKLLPAVEAMLEELVGFYQQLLWDLSPLEQAIVMALAEHDVIQSPAAIADVVNENEGSVRNAARRLLERRWLREVDRAGTDRRTTWYTLREPLLRSFVQYRLPRGRSELALVVDLLRAYFEPIERVRRLREAPGGSEAERYLAASLHSEPPPAFDAGYASRDIEALRYQMRQWINDPSLPPAFGDAGSLVDHLIDRCAQRPPRPLHPRLHGGLDTLLEACSGDRFPDLLDAAGASVGGETGDVLAWLAAGWQIPTDPIGARQRLIELAGRLKDPLSPVALNVEQELALLDVEENPRRAATRLADVLRSRLAQQDAIHPDVIRTRQNLAWATDKAGDRTGALMLCRELLADQVEILEPGHRNILSTRHCETGLSGDHTGALALFREVLTDRLRVLRPDHPLTLGTRHGIAYEAGAGGDNTAVLTLYREVLTDRLRVLGPDHPDTLNTRHDIAYETDQSGDHTEALTLYREVLTDRLRVLGPDHPDTLSTRHSVACGTGECGDHAEALKLHSALLTDRLRILGPDHSLTRRTQAAVSWWTRAVTLDDPVQSWVAEMELAGQDRGQAEQDVSTAVLAVIEQGLTREVPPHLRVGPIGDLFAAIEGSLEAEAKVVEPLRELIAMGRNAIVRPSRTERPSLRG